MGKVFLTSNFIGDKLLELNKELHQSPRGFGGSGNKWAYEISRIIYHDSTISSILDFGCGQGTLIKKLQEWNMLQGIKVCEYDPVIKGKSIIPQERFDLVVCTDVLEYVEYSKLDSVLEYLNTATLDTAFLVISLKEANKIYSNGQNCHLIVESKEWWIDQVKKYFDCSMFANVFPDKNGKDKHLMIILFKNDGGFHVG